MRRPQRLGPAGPQVTNLDAAHGAAFHNEALMGHQPMPDLAPGVYLVVASPADAKGSEYSAPATQWFT